MVYQPGIDYVAKIIWEFPDAEFDIDENTDEEKGTYCAWVNGGWLPNTYQSYNDAAKAIYKYLKEGQ